MEPDLRAAHQPVSIFEPDLRAAVEAEQILEEAAEIALAQRTAEPVRHAERTLVPRYTQCRRQRHEREIRLSEIDVQIRIVLRRRLGGRRGDAADHQRD